MITKHNNASIVAGSMLILFGLLALAGQLFRGWTIWSSSWPLAIVGAGVLFFVAMLLGGKSAAGLAAPASIITAVGLILFVQNLTDYWESWSYAWTIIVIAVGFGNFVMGTFGENQASRQAGLRTMRFGLLLFILFGTFFEGLIFTEHNFRWLGQLIFPIALILVGVYVLLFRSNIFNRNNTVNPEEMEKPEDKR